MASELTSSTEFASLASKLQQSPEDQQLKQKILRYIPQMQELAKTSPLALFHLAHIYSPSSEKYKRTIMQAADLGCVHAMLAACKFLVESPTATNMQKAVHYLQKIAQSNNQFIIDDSKTLLAARPDLALAIKEHSVKNTPVEANSYQFFTPRKPESGSELENDDINQPSNPNQR